jgi:uncharacterized Zn-finger protein
MAAVHEGNKSSIILRMAAVHEGNKPFQCNVCNACFTRKQGLKCHNNSIHENKKPYKCNICDMSFKVHIF